MILLIHSALSCQLKLAHMADPRLEEVAASVSRLMGLVAKCEESFAFVLGQGYNYEGQDQAFRIDLRTRPLTITAQSRLGFLRALIRVHVLPESKIEQVLEEKPALNYRGVMIDSVSRFLPVASIKRTIEAMSLCHLNILHWRIAGDESFSIELKSHPEIHQAGAYSRSEVYSQAQVKELVSYAKAYGVVIVPELSTPGGTRSWSLHPSYSGAAYRCEDSLYGHMLAIQNSTVRDLAKTILQEVQQVFDAKVIHLSGFNVSWKCLSQGNRFKTFMLLHQLKDFNDLQTYWRGELKSWLQPNTHIVFWDSGLPTSESDWVQYTSNFSLLRNYSYDTKSTLVVSSAHLLDLSRGLGNISGYPDPGTYVPWEWIQWYVNLTASGVDLDRVAGLEATLWGHSTGSSNLDNNLWMRAAAVGQKAWSGDFLGYEQAFEEMNSLRRILLKLGYQVSPLTREYEQLGQGRQLQTDI